MLALLAIACCLILPLIVAGVALLVGKRNDSKTEHPGTPPLGAADREGSGRRGEQS